jgi:hypothetical protein
MKYLYPELSWWCNELEGFQVLAWVCISPCPASLAEAIWAGLSLTTFWLLLIKGSASRDFLFYFILLKTKSVLFI